MIHGFNKTTLLDYPGHLAASIFLGGCNFRCPFCHNATLVMSPQSQPIISEDEIFHTLKKRVGILEGVCITGGEPTLYPGLTKLIEKIKELGFLVKLDTNGSNPEIIRELITGGLLDYVAIDIKNSKEKYPTTVDLKSVDIDKISNSISILINSNIEYEFRTTIVKELHELSDIISIGEWIKGGKRYYLQAYRDSDDVIKKGFTSYNLAELEVLREAVLSFVDYVGIRGID